MNEHAEKNSKEVVAYFMTMILLIIEFITKPDTRTSIKYDSFRDIVYRLVRCQPRTEHGRTLLHLLVLPSPFFFHSKGFILLTPSIAVMELLLECGANVNAVDDEHNTALLLCSKALQKHGNWTAISRSWLDEKRGWTSFETWCPRGYGELIGGQRCRDSDIQPDRMERVELC